MKFLIDRMQYDKPYQSDALKNRELFGKSLKNFINSVEDGCVLALDAKWGEGKTTFVKWWQKDLEEDGNGHKTIYFDAFKHDFNCEPFYAIVKELYNQIEGTNELPHEVKDALKKLSEVIIPNLMAFGVMATASAAFGPAGGATGAMAITGAKVLGDSIKTFLSKKTTKTLEQTIKDFKESLETITSKLYLEGSKRLVFIIDELDRCRPNYAVETIEKIKHLFSVAGIIWVLVMNKKQLEESINFIYGTSEPDRYLNKFINATTELPKSLELPYHGVTSEHYNIITRDIFKDYDIRPETKHQLTNYVSFMARVNNLSIRAIQQVVNHLQLLIESKVDNYLIWYLVIISFLSVLKVDLNNIYKKIRDKTATMDLLKKELKMLIIAEQEDAPIAWLKYYIQVLLCKNNSEFEAFINKEKSKKNQDEKVKSEFDFFLENNRDISRFTYGNLLKDTYNKLLESTEF